MTTRRKLFQVAAAFALLAVSIMPALAIEIPPGLALRLVPGQNAHFPTDTTIAMCDYRVSLALKQLGYTKNLTYLPGYRYGVPAAGAMAAYAENEQTNIEALVICLPFAMAVINVSPINDLNKATEDRTPASDELIRALEAQ
jgi:hypothetical protein